MMCKKNIFRTLIPLFEQYECKDFTKLYTYLTNYTMNKNNLFNIIKKKRPTIKDNSIDSYINYIYI
mgnify:CR=1 FL=1